jgi:septal ring factor EnvC (AmiA/AmiB activator)
MFRFLFLNLIFISFFLPSLISAEEPSALCNNNEECENKITEFTKKLNELGSAKNTLANQIKIIDSQVQLTLIKITQTQNSIKTLEKEIADLTVKIDNLDVSLNELTAVYINQISQNYKLQKKLSPVSGFFFNKSFNSFLEQYKYISVLQKNSQDTIVLWKLFGLIMIFKKKLKIKSKLNWKI